MGHNVLGIRLPEHRCQVAALPGLRQSTRASEWLVAGGRALCDADISVCRQAGWVIKTDICVQAIRAVTIKADICEQARRVVTIERESPVRVAITSRRTGLDPKGNLLTCWVQAGVSC